jgi:hypothetical protein
MANELKAPKLDINTLLGISNSAATATSQYNLAQVPNATNAALSATLLSGKAINDANSASYYDALNKIMPNWQGSIIGTQEDALKQSKAMADQLMTGEVPQDVQDAIARTNAENGISRGVFGQALRYNQAATIGKTSLDMKTAGANMYGGVVSPLAAKLLESATKLMPAQTDMASLFAGSFGSILKSISKDASQESSNALSGAIKNAEFAWAAQLGNFNASREDAQISEAQRIQMDQFNILHPQKKTTNTGLGLYNGSYAL